MGYFKGWKRKLGCATLAIACVFTAGWIRSRTTVDQIAIDGRSDGMNIVCSTSGALQFLQWRGRDLTAEQFSPTNSIWTSAPNVIPIQVQNNWSWFPGRLVLQKDYGPDLSRVASEGIYGPNRVATGKGIVLPYWLVVLPLTLISAWLLLSRPGPRRSRVTADLIPQPPIQK